MSRSVQRARAIRRALASLALSLAACVVVAFPLPVAALVRVELEVTDVAASSRFFCGLLGFAGEAPAAGAQEQLLRLGDEVLLLRARAAGAAAPDRGVTSDDPSFQHIAIVVRDMQAASDALSAAGVRLISRGPQTLPAWNYDAGGIKALYFRDPDGHALELIQFPPDKGEPKWQRAGGPLFLGIDHSAIVVADAARSRTFYQGGLGLKVVGESLNYGDEQERLSGVPGAEVAITALRGPIGPGIELIEYRQPHRRHQIREHSDWRLLLSATTPGSPTAAGEHDDSDPDGHRLRLVSRDGTFADEASDAFHRHWSRYLMEGAELGIFMIVALYLTIALEHRRSPLRRAIGPALARRALMGLGIGITVAVLIYSRWGRQSGAQFNPAVTIAMLSLGRMTLADALFYVLAQFIGALVALALASLPARKAAASPAVRFVVTEPGERGAAAAVLAELGISFTAMLLLRLVSQSDQLRPYIGAFAGVMLFLFITFEAPFSGMSLNPARTAASSVLAARSRAWWIYVAAPVGAMLAAAAISRI